MGWAGAGFVAEQNEGGRSSFGRFWVGAVRVGRFLPRTQYVAIRLLLQVSITRVIPLASL